MINWFPGHMAKANKQILDSLKSVDLILQVVDARAINTTKIKDFNGINKPILYVALKSDLADLNNISQPNVIIGNTKNKSFKSILLNKIKQILAPLEAKKKAKGIANPNFYIMVVGLPNVGKSSLINFLANKKIAITGNQPAITKSQSIWKIADDLYLQDNPGVFFKKITDDKDGYILALLNTIKKEVVPMREVLKFCYDYLDSRYQSKLLSFYHLDNPINFEQFIERYAKQRHFIINNNELDIHRAELALYDDFISGKICKVNYEN